MIGLSSTRPSWAVPLNSAELTHASVIKWQYSASLIVGQLANCTLEYSELSRPHVSSSNRLASLFNIVAVTKHFPRFCLHPVCYSPLGNAVHQASLYSRDEERFHLLMSRDTKTHSITWYRERVCFQFYNLL